MIWVEWNLIIVLFKCETKSDGKKSYWHFKDETNKQTGAWVSLVKKFQNIINFDAIIDKKSCLRVLACMHSIVPTIQFSCVFFSVRSTISSSFGSGYIVFQTLVVRLFVTTYYWIVSRWIQYEREVILNDLILRPNDNSENSVQWLVKLFEAFKR